MQEAINEMPFMRGEPEKDSPEEAVLRWGNIILRHHNGGLRRKGLDAVCACLDYLDEYTAPARRGEKETENES